MESNNINNNNNFQMRGLPIQQARRDPNRVQNLQMVSNGNGFEMSQNIPNSSQVALNQPYYAPGMIEPQNMPGPGNYQKRIKKGDEEESRPYNMNRRNLNISQNPDTSMNANLDSSMLYNTQPNAPMYTNGMQGGFNESSRGYNNLQNESSLEMSQAGLFMKGKRPNVPTGKPLPVQNGGGPINFSPNMSGLQKLAMLPSIFVKQKFEMLEMLTGCETENRYKVYATDQGLDKVGRPIFKCKEKSGFFARNLLSGDCRPFGMIILHEDREEDDEADDMFLFLDRPCRFTVGCMNRPEITVTIKENGLNKYIGKVVSEWACCDMIFTVYGANNDIVYRIDGNCCQWGLYCNCPCKSCAKIIFNIQNVRGENIGEINKLYSGVAQELLTDTDNFCCIFPPMATPEDKALLLALVLFIDFRYFEQSPAQNNGLV